MVVDEHSASDLQLDWRFLSLRRPENLLVFEVQTTIERAMRDYWATHGYLELHSPKLMHSASESGAETFATPYFELGRAYLAQSPQFLLSCVVSKHELPHCFSVPQSVAHAPCLHASNAPQ